MKAADLPIPGIRLGDYPERRVVLPDTAARAGRVLLARITAWCVSAGGRGPHRRFTRNVEAARVHLATVATDEFPARVTALRANLSRQGLSDAMMTQVMALVAVACERELGLRPYVTQITAARVMLDGRLAELATGEGKTLAMALAAAVAALAGIPVHAVTANDYLVARDAARLRPLFAALGLTSGAVTQPLDAAGRRCAYACDIVYCTAKELAFDYLRDGLADAAGGSALGAPGAPLLRGLCWAMIDEADSILIDEARMPLVISRAAVDAGERAYHRHALALAGQLHVGGDFSIDHEARDAALTATGRDKIEALAAPLGAVWRNRRHREETVIARNQAIRLSLFKLERVRLSLSKPYHF